MPMRNQNLDLKGLVFSLGVQTGSTCHGVVDMPSNYGTTIQEDQRLSEMLSFAGARILVMMLCPQGRYVVRLLRCGGSSQVPGHHDLQ